MSRSQGWYSQKGPITKNAYVKYISSSHCSKDISIELWTKDKNDMPPILDLGGT